MDAVVNSVMFNLFTLQVHLDKLEKKIRKKTFVMRRHVKCGPRWLIRWWCTALQSKSAVF